VPASVASWVTHWVGVQSQPERMVFMQARLSEHTTRLNSRTGSEGPPVSSLYCDRPLHSGLVVPELVMGAGCRITDGCHQPDVRYAALPS